MSIDSTTSSETSISDLGKDLWSYLTGQQATIDYTFIDMTIEVPRTTGHDSERADWKLNGTLRITTADMHNQGAAHSSSG